MIPIPIGAWWVIGCYLAGLLTGWVLRPAHPSRLVALPPVLKDEECPRLRPRLVLDAPAVRERARRWERPEVVRWSERKDGG